MEQSTLDNGASEPPSYCNTSLHEVLFSTGVISMDLLLWLPWSRDEINQTVDEVRRRASPRPDFRKLAWLTRYRARQLKPHGFRYGCQIRGSRLSGRGYGLRNSS